MIQLLGKNKIFTDEFIYQLQQNESVETVANNFNISALQIKQENKDAIFKCGKCIVLFNNSKTYHIVKPCETLESIARLYDTSAEKIKEKNKVKTLFIGMRLII